jgi:multiple sugar transport system permease protein
VALKRSLYMKSNTKFLIMFLGIPILILLVLVVFPLGYSLNMSFFKYNMLTSTSMEFVGFKNYLQILQNPIFWSSLKITLHFIGLSVLIQMILGLALALLLYRPFKGAHVIRTAFLFPYVVPGVIAGITWKWVLNPDYGILRYITEKPILGSTSTAIYGLIVADVWHMTAFVFILIMAGLQSLPDSVYEAASIDGANPLQKLIFITLPLIKRVFFITLIIRLVESLKTFDKVYALTSGGPGLSTQILSWSIYLEAFKGFNLGYAAAMSYLLLIMVLFIVIIYSYMIKENEV